jgi:hypothetical protein
MVVLLYAADYAVTPRHGRREIGLVALVAARRRLSRSASTLTRVTCQRVPLHLATNLPHRHQR